MERAILRDRAGAPKLGYLWIGRGAEVDWPLGRGDQPLRSIHRYPNFGVLGISVVVVKGVKAVKGMTVVKGVKAVKGVMVLVWLYVCV